MPVKLIVREHMESPEEYEQRINTIIGSYDHVRVVGVSIAAAPFSCYEHDATEFVLYTCVHYEDRLL